MKLFDARVISMGGTGDADAALVLAEALNAIEQLCDKPMNDGTPWWVFRDAVRDILEKD